MSNEQDGLLTETIARHFPQARVSENEIDLGFGGLSIGCRVNSVGEFGVFKTASLFFQLRGGALGDSPVFASISGYGDSEHDAVVTGGCNWACSFGPVLRAGLAGEANSKVERFDVTVDGQGYQLFVDGIDRTFWSSGGDQAAERTRIVRARLGGWPWLSRVMLDSGRVAKEDTEKPLPAGRLAGLVAPGKLKLMSGGGRCFAPRSLLDPCEGCVHLATYWGLEEDVFPPGAPPLEGREEEPSPGQAAPVRGGRVGSWFRRFRR